MDLWDDIYYEVSKLSARLPVETNVIEMNNRKKVSTYIHSGQKTFSVFIDGWAVAIENDCVSKLFSNEFWDALKCL